MRRVFVYVLTTWRFLMVGRVYLAGHAAGGDEDSRRASYLRVVIAVVAMAAIVWCGAGRAFQEQIDGSLWRVAQQSADFDVRYRPPPRSIHRLLTR